MDAALAEYLRYSFPKQRPLDENYIRNYDVTNLTGLAETIGAPTWKPNFPGPVNATAMDGEDTEEPKPRDGILPSFPPVPKFKENGDDNAFL